MDVRDLPLVATVPLGQVLTLEHSVFPYPPFGTWRCHWSPEVTARIERQTPFVGEGGSSWRTSVYTLDQVGTFTLVLQEMLLGQGVTQVAEEWRKVVHVSP